MAQKKLLHSTISCFIITIIYLFRCESEISVCFVYNMTGVNLVVKHAMQYLLVKVFTSPDSWSRAGLLKIVLNTFV